MPAIPLLHFRTDVNLLAQPPAAFNIFSTSRSFTGISSYSNEHGLWSKYTPESSYASNIGDFTKLPYVILDNHISQSEALMLLGRLVANIEKPLQSYVPQWVSPSDLDASGDGPVWTNSQYSSNPPSTISSTSTLLEPTTAHTMFPNVDPSIFVLPDLPLSQSESTSATLLHTSSYSTQTRSILTALLGLSFSFSNINSRTFNLTSKVIRTLSVTQHTQVFAALMRIHGREIKKAVKASGGTMFFVIGVKIATDATVETREEREKCRSGKIDIDLTHGMGISSGMREVGRIKSDYERQRERKNVCTEKVDGDRAFAMEYCSVKLQRKIEFVKRDEEHRRMKEMAAEARRELERDFSEVTKGKVPVGETVTKEGKLLFIYQRDLEKLTMVKGDAVWSREMRYKWLREIIDRSESLKKPNDTSFQCKDEDALEKELEREQVAIQEWHRRKETIKDLASLPYHNHPHYRINHPYSYGSCGGYPRAQFYSPSSSSITNPVLASNLSNTPLSINFQGHQDFRLGGAHPYSKLDNDYNESYNNDYYSSDEMLGVSNNSQYPSPSAPSAIIDSRVRPCQLYGSNYLSVDTLDDNVKHNADANDPTTQSVDDSIPSTRYYGEFISCSWQPSPTDRYFPGSFLDKNQKRLDSQYFCGGEEDEYEIKLGTKVITEVYNGNIFDGRAAMNVSFMG